MKCAALIIVFVYSCLSLIAFTLGLADSDNLYYFSACRKKPTYFGHYSGFDYMIRLGCKAGKPMEEE